MLNIKFNWFTILFIVVINFDLMAQVDTCRSSLSGKVIDEHDKSALEFATVYISELQIGTLTDSAGNYKISNICDGSYTVKVSHLGCETIQERILIKGRTIKNFFPEHHTEYLKDLEVSALKPIEQTTQSKTVVSEEILDQAKGQSLGDALKSVTGVNTLNTGSSISKPVIHGMHSNRILILNNGIRQEGQQWGTEHAPEVDLFIANKLSVIKGANSIRYGSDAIAGTILVETKPLPESEGIAGELNLIGMSNGRSGTASAYLEGNFKKLRPLSWRVQGTVKQGGNVSAPNYTLINSGVREQNFSYAIGWMKKKYGIDLFYSQFNSTFGIFSASHIGNLTDLNRAFNSPVPLETGSFTYKIGRPSQHTEHELFKIKSFINTGNIGKLSILYARQYNLRYEYDKHTPLNDSLKALNKPDLKFEITTHTCDVIWEHNRIKQFTGSIGVSGITQANTYEGRALIPNFQNYSGGMFIIERWKKNRFEIEGGIRYDYKWMQVFKYQYIGNATYELINPIHKFENFTGNLGGIFHKDSTLNISINIGTAWRAPSINELYSNGLHHGAAALEFGDNTLQSERTNNTILTVLFNPTDRINIEASPYVHFINNFIYRQPASTPMLTIHGAFPAFYYKQTNAVLKGLDFNLRYKLTNLLEISEKASILRARNKTENDWLILMPSDRFTTELTFRFRNNKKIVSSYLSTSFVYVTKQTRAPANVDFAPPPPAYYTLNIHGACSISMGKQNVEFGVSVFNLLNESYRDYLDRFRYFTDAMGRNISLRVKIPFNV